MSNLLRMIPIFVYFNGENVCGEKASLNNISLPHQAGIELSDFHARGWKSDQGGQNSMQEMHGNQTKCMEFRPIKENSNF